MRILRALAAVLFAGIATAASAAPPLWEVSDADSRIWLFGSVHVLPKDLNWHTPALGQIVAKATKVYFEADVGIAGQIAVTMKALAGGFKATQDWFDQLTWFQQMEVMQAARTLGVPIAQVKGFDPWLSESILDEKSMEKLGYHSALGVDTLLQAVLPKEKKAYFETINGQLELFAAQPMAGQISRLIGSLEHFDGLSDSLKTMVDTWSAGDVEALAKAISDDPTAGESFAQVMILDRNKAWLPTIEGLLKSNEQDLIVVGSGHLAGNGSVVDLLAKDGFTVKRIQ
jgi:uncharacterized protein YbaP (TraB family)